MKIARILPALRRHLLTVAVVIAAGLATPWIASSADQPAAQATEPVLPGFSPKKAPARGKLLLKTGDRLAIVGDSITEQKMYSRIMETYLTVCVPELQITARQFGWSGETAEGFRSRMTNDCLRFLPTVATTCYGMNDYRYRPYNEVNARWYRSNYTEVVRAFKTAGCRVILGSPGCVGKVAAWVKTASGTLEEHNAHLGRLRNIDIQIAAQEHVRFADVFGTMWLATSEAKKMYGPDYAVSGHDGVHPGWAGHLVMAYDYLRAMGLDGDLGTFTVNLKSGRAKATTGHTVDSFADGQLSLTSRRYPYCAAGELDKDNSIRSGMALVPFNQELNRLMLVVKGASAEDYRVTWGSESRVYSAKQLARGVNLAADFVVNPFSEAFKRVDEAVAAKQAYETKQIKEVFHGQEARADMAGAVARTEAERAPLVRAVQDAFVPVTHTLLIQAQ